MLENNVKVDRYFRKKKHFYCHLLPYNHSYVWSLCYKSMYIRVVWMCSVYKCEKKNKVYGCWIYTQHIHRFVYLLIKSVYGIIRFIPT